MTFAWTFTWAPGPYLAVALAALVFLWTVLDRRRLAKRLDSRLAKRLGTGSQLAAMLASVSFARHYLGRGLLACALGLTVLAASGPRVAGRHSGEQLGIDVVTVIDYSTSMLAADVYPDRLSASKRAVETILDASAGDRVGVVVFAGAAAHFPLTHDRAAVRTMFRGLEVQDLPPGSNLAEAVRVGRCLVRPGRLDDPGCGGVGGRGRGGQPLDPPGADADDSADDSADDGAVDRPAAHVGSERGRALIVFTDGEETDGDARTELALATRLGIEVYLVGVGTAAGAPVPDIDPRGYRLGWKKTDDGTPVESRLELAKLTELAELAGGPERLFGLGAPGRPLAELPRALDALQRGVWRTRSVGRHRDIHEWFLFPAFMLLLIEATMSTRRRSRPPAGPENRT